MAHPADDGEDLVDNQVIGEPVTDFCVREIERGDRFRFRRMPGKQAAIPLREIEALVVAIVADGRITHADIEEGVLLMGFECHAVVVVEPDRWLDGAAKITPEPCERGV